MVYGLKESLSINRSERLLPATFYFIRKYCGSLSGVMFYFVVIHKIMAHPAITKYCMAHDFVAGSPFSSV